MVVAHVRLEGLTERERDVMKLVVEGLPNKLVADQLDISVRTVEVHRARVFDKMQVKSAVELANLQREVEQTHNQPEGGAPTSFLLLLAFGAFAGGVVIGVMALRAYYRKRLHGLRI